MLRFLQMPEPQKAIPRCAFCSAFREKDATQISGETKEQERDRLMAVFVPSPCLRLMPYCKDAPRIQ